ncbi:MAG: uracil-DNA glycosylase [Saprospiraceae bacterium]|jgi:uracil-DNA glycosylase
MGDDIEVGWKRILKDEFEKPYITGIRETLSNTEATGKPVYPPSSMIFNAFNLTSFDKVKVIIIGQDPYHNPGEAMGLSFSVPRGVRVPPSLRNIYKELARDINFEIPPHGDLSSWATQGVFLLNAMLTVEHKKAGSHKKIGWQQFTDAVIQVLSMHKRGLVFLLWGRFAESKASLIDNEKHHVLIAAHPSPLARNAYNGSRHFSQTNAILKKQGMQTIDWQLPL